MFITMNWRGRSLVSFRTIIESTTALRTEDPSRAGLELLRGRSEEQKPPRGPHLAVAPRECFV
jgi:hypothetical protein